jgi:hypothetical protein
MVLVPAMARPRGAQSKLWRELYCRPHRREPFSKELGREPFSKELRREPFSKELRRELFSSGESYSARSSARGRPYLLGDMQTRALSEQTVLLSILGLTQQLIRLTRSDVGGDESNYLAHYSILRFPHNTPIN